MRSVPETWAVAEADTSTTRQEHTPAAAGPERPHRTNASRTRTAATRVARKNKAVQRPKRAKTNGPDIALPSAEDRLPSAASPPRAESARGQRMQKKAKKHRAPASVPAAQTAPALNAQKSNIRRAVRAGQRQDVPQARQPPEQKTRTPLKRRAETTVHQGRQTITAADLPGGPPQTPVSAAALHQKAEDSAACTTRQLMQSRKEQAYTPAQIAGKTERHWRKGGLRPGPDPKRITEFQSRAHAARPQAREAPKVTRDKKPDPLFQQPLLREDRQGVQTAAAKHSAKETHPRLQTRSGTGHI